MFCFRSFITPPRFIPLGNYPQCRVDTGLFESPSFPSRISGTVTFFFGLLFLNDLAGDRASSFSCPSPPPSERNSFFFLPPFLLGLSPSTHSRITCCFPPPLNTLSFLGQLVHASLFSVITKFFPPPRSYDGNISTYAPFSPFPDFAPLTGGLFKLSPSLVCSNYPP